MQRLPFLGKGTTSQAAEQLDVAPGFGWRSVQRCDNWIAFSSGLSRWVTMQVAIGVFPLPA